MSQSLQWVLMDLGLAISDCLRPKSDITRKRWLDFMADGKQSKKLMAMSEERPWTLR